MEQTLRDKSQRDIKSDFRKFAAIIDHLRFAWRIGARSSGALNHLDRHGKFARKTPTQASRHE